jgi:outer membrane protein OmpA-like peptidoglycan-associated protein
VTIKSFTQIGPLGRQAVLMLLLNGAWIPAIACGIPVQQMRMAGASAEELLEQLDPISRPRCGALLHTPIAEHRICANHVPAKRAAASRVASRDPVAYAPEAPGVVVSFDYQSVNLRPDDRALLNNLTRALLDPRLVDRKFSVAGHTDSAGKHKLNLDISCQRALVVRAYLVKNGIEDHRITVFGFGDEIPVSGRFDAGNRRVDIRLEP